MPVKSEFLNLIERPDGKLDDKGECGLLGLAFHPQFSRNGRYFGYYSLRIGGQLHQRLSRFEGDQEQPLITQLDPAGNHNGGDLHFGPELTSLTKFDEVIFEGDEQNGYMKVATPRGSGWVKAIMMRRQ